VSLRVVFMGSPGFAVPTLLALHDNFHVVGVFTQHDRPQGRGLKTRPTAVKEAALRLNLPVEEPERVSAPESIGILKLWAPDIIAVAAYGKILPVSVLDLPPLGCVNLHASLLPRHRGAAPIPAAILAGDTVTGVCTIRMDKGMDTGDIFLTEQIEISADETAGSLHDKLMKLGAGLVVNTLRMIEEGTIEPAPQDHSKATYTKLIAKDDGRIDWSRPAEYLDRLVRAMDPWPGAFCLLSGETIRVRKASEQPGSEAPGTVVALVREGILVGTGDGLLLLQEVQAPSKKRVSAAEFARGRRLKPGEAFTL
jgi:methionyl-tRNA formyltransferase